MKEFIDRHIKWSESAFGSGYDCEGIVNHIREELDEILDSPADLYEWIDVIFLALDGAWRAGYSVEDIVFAMSQKQRINFDRKWNVSKKGLPNKHIVKRY